MFPKLFVFGLLAILAVQSFSEAKNVLHKNEVEEDVLETIELIKRLVLAAEVTADKVTSNLFDEIKLDASEVFNVAVKKIGKSADAMYAEFAKFPEDADALNVDISECLQGKEGEIKELVSLVFDNMKQCTDAAIYETLSLVQQVMQEYRRLKVAAEELERAFENCSNELCFQQLLFGANELLLTLPTELKDILEEGLNSIEYVQANLPECDHQITGYFHEVTRRIYKYVYDCVTDKIEGGSKN